MGTAAAGHVAVIHAPAQPITPAIHWDYLVIDTQIGMRRFIDVIAEYASRQCC